MQYSDEALVREAVLIARRCGARPEDAEDLAQDALLKLVTYAESVADPRAWLFVVIGRLWRRRRMRAEPRMQLATFDPWSGVELDIDTRRILERLNDRRRNAFLLALLGHSEREIGERLGCSVKATEKALHRARQSLRASLQLADRAKNLFPG